MKNHKSGRVFGYVKEYTGGLNTQEQVRMLEKYVSAYDLIAERPGRDTNDELQTLKQLLRPGDTFYAVSPVCFSMRSSVQIKELRWMQKHNIGTRFLVLPSTLSASTASEERLLQTLLIEILSYVADQEADSHEGNIPTLPERTNRHVGRPKIPIPKGFNKIYRLWIEQRISTAEAIRRSGLKRSTFYNITKELRLSKCNSKPSAAQTARPQDGGK